VGLASLLCCSQARPGGSADGAAAGLIQSSPDAWQTGGTPHACRADKIQFSQAKGCMNDGSNEFCLPSADAAVLARVQAIAPKASCGPGSGRAHCAGGVELLCTLPTGPAECVAAHGALTDQAWAQHCSLAALPQVKRIVHTWFE